MADGQLACSLGFMKTIAVIGTMDTKGEEHEYVAQRIRNRGHQVLLIDLGTGASPQVLVDITRDQVAEAGGVDLQLQQDVLLLFRGKLGERDVHMVAGDLVGEAVQISEVPLAERIQAISGQDGVMVARPLEGN